MSSEFISNWIEILYILITGLVIGYLGLLVKPGRGWAKFVGSNRFQPFSLIVAGYFFILVLLPIIFFFIYPSFYTWILFYIKYSVPCFFACIGLYFILILLYIRARLIRRWKFIAVPFILAFLAYLIVNT